MNKHYKTKPIAGEGKYVDFDDESMMYCVFGSDSGFAYASYADKGEANRKLEEMLENTKIMERHDNA